MMRITRYSKWVVLLIVFIVSLLIFFTQIDRVQATFSDAHAAVVLLRFETEIMQKTPAGQYYESLFWKHNDELIEIASKYPEHRVDFSNVTRMFIPEIEALLDGKGDAVYVSREDIESLKAELAWFASVGSPALHDDIQKELERFPLDQFIAMSLNEAMDFVNSSWIPESIVEKSLVPDSDGQWAYYVLNGVYFEYPKGYTLQVSDSLSNSAYLIPSSNDMPNYWNPCIVRIGVFSVSPDQKDKYDPHSWYSTERVLCETNIQNVDFPGTSFSTSNSDYPISYLYGFQYNATNQLAVRISVYRYQNSVTTRPQERPDTMNQRYEYFKHMVESLRIQAK
jgi:hypothetical protein